MILSKSSLACLALALPLMWLAPAAVRAEHALIDLQVVGPSGVQRAADDHEPPAGGLNPRPKMTVTAGDPLVLQFLLTNIYPHTVLKKARVRYFVVRTDELGVKVVPDLKGDAVVTQGTATLNFKTQARVGARLQFRVDKPGVYLVRVETQNTGSDHEHFSAIDLVVE